MEVDDIMEKGNEAGVQPETMPRNSRGGGFRRCGEHGGGLVVQQRLIMVKAGERRQSGTGQKWGRIGRSGEEGKWVGPRAQ
jgi:hypothetical protein